MRIAIIGSGAMGMLFGGYLSKVHEVVLIDTDRAKVDKVNQDGIRIEETDGSITEAHPQAVVSADGLGEMDLVILFVKAMYSRIALEAGQGLIGPDTLVLSLQNGAGHDTIIKEFVPEQRTVIGTTQHNSSIVGPGVIHHGGGGRTFIGLASGEAKGLQAIAETFNRCGFETEISDRIQRKVWEKLFVNASASALSAILQARLGFMAEDQHAWLLTRQLIKEAVAVANKDGMGFEEEEIATAVHRLLQNARDGWTSICADIRDGRKTEVDTISGAVVAASNRNGEPAPGHEFVVRLIHAMEDRRNA